MKIVMSFDTVMDRPVDSHVHYISPGGYEFRFASDVNVRFDFTDSCGNTDEREPNIVHWEVRYFDEDIATHTADFFAQQLKDNGVAGAIIEEFFG